jgi:hypothetical protein
MCNGGLEVVNTLSWVKGVQVILVSDFVFSQISIETREEILTSRSHGNVQPSPFYFIEKKCISLEVIAGWSSVKNFIHL